MQHSHLILILVFADWCPRRFPAAILGRSLLHPSAGQRTQITTVPRVQGSPDINRILRLPRNMIYSQTIQISNIFPRSLAGIGCGYFNCYKCKASPSMPVRFAMSAGIHAEIGSDCFQSSSMRSNMLYSNTVLHKKSLA